VVIRYFHNKFYYGDAINNRRGTDIVFCVQLYINWQYLDTNSVRILLLLQERARRIPSGTVFPMFVNR